MRICRTFYPKAVLALTPISTVPSTRKWRVGYRTCWATGRLLLKTQPARILFCSDRRDISRHYRRKQLSAAAWAGEFQTAASSSFDLEDPSEASLHDALSYTYVSNALVSSLWAQWLQGNSKFKQLCHSQLKLISTVLQKPQGAYNTRITLYRREAATLDAGQLQLSKITTFTDPGVQTSPPDLDGTLFLGLAGTAASSRGAEKALTEAQLVDLPNTGAFVLPLAAHSFLVGLLVIEQIALLPHLAAGNNDVALQQLQPRQSAETALGSSVEDVMLSGKDREIVQLAGQVLSSACAMDLHSALERAQSAMRSQQVLGLVEEVRGPLTALRTLGSILVPRLRQKEGQEIDRDVAQGILTQGDRLQEVVSQLQAAIHPIALPSTFGPVSKGGLPAAPKPSKQLRNNTTIASQTRLPPMKQDSSADDQLQA